MAKKQYYQVMWCLIKIWRPFKNKISHNFTRARSPLLEGVVVNYLHNSTEFERVLKVIFSAHRGT